MVKRWIRVLHKVDCGYYSMRNRNWDEYECPECNTRFEHWQRGSCPSCNTTLERPIFEELKIIEH